ncbi:MAG TPA: tetratricopeptide repeat protein [Candidatus Acidoferrum sp.]|nr:tetratricopeptide repeat protein [Candidatus Acidoferrum sp.]
MSRTFAHSLAAFPLRLVFVNFLGILGCSLIRFDERLRHRTVPVFSCLLILAVALTAIPTRAQAGPSSSPASFADLSTRANTARDANRLELAVGLYRRALALRPRWVEGWWSLGTIEYDQNDYASAARAFEKVRALDSKAGTARVMLGLCKFELGQDDSALKYIEEGKAIGIADDPQLWHVMLYHEGVLLQRRGRFESAQESLVRVCADGVEDDNVTRALGMTALRMSGKDAPVEGSPGASVVSGVGRAQCMAARRKFDEARENFAAVEKNYPQYPNLHYAYGRFLIEVNDTAGAVQEFQQEIQNNPDHIFALLQIAAVKYRVDSQGGLPYAEQAVKRNPQMPLAHYLLGLLLVDTHDYARAVPELETAQRAFPQEAKVYFALAAAYAHTGRPDEAARAKATFLRLNQQTVAAPNVYGQERPGVEREMLGKEPEARIPQR